MIPRYTLPEMGAIWSDVARFEAMLRVELEVARAQSARGQVPPEALVALETRSRVDVERIAEIERTTDHDVIAFVSQVAETVGPEGRYLHLGLTSSDVVDTGLALQLRAAGERLLLDCDRLLAVLIGRARTEAGTVMMGRTHSVHAEPTTFGLKLAGWAFELERGRVRLSAAVDEIATGKISGPVGTYSHLGPDIEAEVLGALGLHADPVSTQIVQRDRHAGLLTAVAILGGSLERFATEIRNLQHTEIGEVQEPFRTGQKGSSAMPHKRNPILSERIAGLARLLRGYAHTALEDQPLWHERDISHSSAERVILPDATIVLDYMLVRMTALVDGLIVRSERMRENIARGLGLHASSRVLVALVDDGGLSREDAYAVVQRASLRAADERAPLRDLLAVDPGVAQRLSLAQLDACFDEAAFLRHVPEVMTRLDGLSEASGGAHRRVEGDGRCWLSRSCARARSATCICSTTAGCCWSPRIGSRAFDVVLPSTIPDKGRVLTGLSRFWFAETAGIIANHLLATAPEVLPRRSGASDGSAGREAPDFGPLDDLRGRLMICRPASVVPIEAVVRGYLAGLGLEGIPRARDGLRDRAPGRPARERPAARADLHAGDEGRSGRPRREHQLRPDDRARRGMAARTGTSGLPARWPRRSATGRCGCTGTVRPSRRGAGSCSPTRSSSSAWPRRRTSGAAGPPTSGDEPNDPRDRLILIDEALTPDSSRFWDAATYAPGRPQASFDKQFVRDWLETQPWDKTAPGPALPDDVVAGTRARYIEAYERITGASFERYLREDVIGP